MRTSMDLMSINNLYIMAGSCIEYAKFYTLRPATEGMTGRILLFFRLLFFPCFDHCAGLFRCESPAGFTPAFLAHL